MRDCQACDTLLEHAPEFMTAGVTDAVQDSLEQDTGLNALATEVNNDCTDLNLANDCLVGNLENEIDEYELCEWREFLKGAFPKIHKTIKAIIASICGLWTSTHKLENQLGEQVFRTYHYTLSASTFDRSIVEVPSGAGTGNGIKVWFSGTTERENYIEIPITEMKYVTSVFAQPYVGNSATGRSPYPASIAIQDYEQVGDNLIVNFDATEITPAIPEVQPVNVKIDFLILGTK